MGMYTELILGAKLKSETPPEVIATLKFMCQGGDGVPPEGYPFPLSGRYNWMFTMGSYYFGVTHAVPPLLQYDDIGRQWIIATRSNLKDYSNEIETFLAWLEPWIAQGSGRKDFYAIVCYEEATEPTIYYLQDE